MNKDERKSNKKDATTVSENASINLLKNYQGHKNFRLKNQNLLEKGLYW